jgi:hypothetical protein
MFQFGIGKRNTDMHAFGKYVEINKLKQPQIPSPRSSKIYPKHTFQLRSSVLFIIPEDYALTNQFSTQPLIYDIPCNIKILSGPLTIIP